MYQNGHRPIKILTRPYRKYVLIVFSGTTEKFSLGTNIFMYNSSIMMSTTITCNHEIIGCRPFRSGCSHFRFIHTSSWYTVFCYFTVLLTIVFCLHWGIFCLSSLYLRNNTCRSFFIVFQIWVGIIFINI